MSDDEFKKNFNLKLPEHIRFIDGYLASLNRLTQRDGYKHLFWIRMFDYSDSPIESVLYEELEITVKKLVPIKKYIGDIEKAIKWKLQKYFLGNKSNNANCVENTIEFLVWDVAEYFDWLEDFTYSCVVEKGSMQLKNGDTGEIFCFLLNQEHFVVFCIQEVKINNEA